MYYIFTHDDFFVSSVSSGEELGTPLGLSVVVEDISIISYTTARALLNTVVLEQIGIHDSSLPHVAVTASESIDIRSTALFNLVSSIFEQVGIRSFSLQFLTIPTFESVYAHSAASAIANVEKRVSEIVKIDAQSFPNIRFGISEVVYISDSSPLSAIRAESRELLSARSTSNIVSQHTRSIVDVAGVRTFSFGGSLGFVTEYFGVRDATPFISQTARQFIRESFVVRATLPDPVLRIFSTALARVGIKTNIAAHVNFYVALQEHAFVHASSFIPFVPVLPSFYDAVPALNLTSVWTADGRSWGMSRYIGVPVAEWVSSGNIVFGAGPSGLFVRSGDAPISWIETARLRFEDQFANRLEKKHLSTVYTYAQHALPLDVAVSGNYQGSWSTYYYAQSASAVDATRAVRTSVGKGFDSTYYSLRIGGSAFDIYKIETEATLTLRRVGIA